MSRILNIGAAQMGPIAPDESRASAVARMIDLLRQAKAAGDAVREEVVARRCKFELNKARDRAHVLCGLAVAVSNVDEVVRLIRSSPDPATARARLMERHWPAHDIAGYIRLIDDPLHKVADDGTYRLSELQARAILDLGADDSRVQVPAERRQPAPLERPRQRDVRRALVPAALRDEEQLERGGRVND